MEEENEKVDDDDVEQVKKDQQNRNNQDDQEEMFIPVTSLATVSNFIDRYFTRLYKKYRKQDNPEYIRDQYLFIHSNQ